jgi:hypothetical protein
MGVTGYAPQVATQTWLQLPFGGLGRHLEDGAWVAYLWRFSSFYIKGENQCLIQSHRSPRGAL